MSAFIIRIILAVVATFFNVYLFVSGHWGWGITFIFITALIILSFFRNENMILALNQMRVGNQDKAKAYINKITHTQFLPRKQHAYVLYLRAVLGAQELGFTNAEQLLRKALGLGLRTNEDNAVARMHLAGICAQTGRRQEALTLLAEDKKHDKNNGDEGDACRKHTPVGNTP
jgi:tetratricopeptide (TPR) repeat protein